MKIQIWVTAAVSILGLLILISGCAPPLTADVIKALSSDTASFCAKTGVRGGVGAVAMPAAGGYGSAEFEFCRSNYPNSKVTLSPDGSISITHGSDVK